MPVDQIQSEFKSTRTEYVAHVNKDIIRVVSGLMRIFKVRTDLQIYVWFNAKYHFSSCRRLNL